jgi:hypothetical protein
MVHADAELDCVLEIFILDVFSEHSYFLGVHVQEWLFEVKINRV